MSSIISTINLLCHINLIAAKEARWLNQANFFIFISEDNRARSLACCCLVSREIQYYRKRKRRPGRQAHAFDYAVEFLLIHKSSERRKDAKRELLKLQILMELQFERSHAPRHRHGKQASI